MKYMIGFVGYLLFVGMLWAATLYVAAHFIVKFW